MGWKTEPKTWRRFAELLLREFIAALFVVVAAQAVLSLWGIDTLAAMGLISAVYIATDWAIPDGD
jgi:hypothetical protein